ncbi:MAG: gamma carbonic anhydrase family protein [Candidatus Lindowbacteria bacterium]|nr:gamma carbonic anhydrase family protein [Candidatus Lindowbacteria bacterium]
MPIYEFEGRTPEIGEGSFIHPEATVIGGVKIGKNCFIGPGARLRGDWCNIEIGDGSNVQDNCIIHARPDFTVVLGPNSHVGHGSVLHGVILHEHVLVGMNAVIQDFADIGDNCIIGSGCVIPPRMQVPAKKVVMGVPGKIIGDVTPEQEQLWRFATGLYQTLPKRYSGTSRRTK